MFFFSVPPVPALTPGDVPAFLTTDELFSPEEVDFINAVADRTSAKQATVGLENRVDFEYNRSTLRVLEPNEEIIWIYERLAHAAALMNAKAFRFDLAGFDQPLNHLTYEAHDQGFYDWHTDLGGHDSPTRKISITVQLSDEADYEGGDLELNALGHVDLAPRRRGAVVAFPSFYLHRVAPVRRGVRKALVTWVVGPPFR